jgi:hypothetical protein
MQYIAEIKNVTLFSSCDYKSSIVVYYNNLTIPSVFAPATQNGPCFNFSIGVSPASDQYGLLIQETTNTSNYETFVLNINDIQPQQFTTHNFDDNFTFCVTNIIGTYLSFSATITFDTCQPTT